MFEKIMEWIVVMTFVTGLCLGLYNLASMSCEYDTDMYVISFIIGIIWCGCCWLVTDTLYDSYKTERNLMDFYTNYRK